MSSLSDALNRIRLASASSVEEVTSVSEDNTMDPIDCYRHLITVETNRYAE